LVLVLSFAKVIPQLGLLPVAWGFAAAIVGAVVGSYLTTPSKPDALWADLGL
jgi:hypothetical protein